MAKAADGASAIAIALNTIIYTFKGVLGSYYKGRLLALILVVQYWVAFAGYILLAVRLL